MSDVFRAVTFSRGGRPVELLNLEQLNVAGEQIVKERDSLRFEAPAPTNVDTQSARRFGGARTVAQSHANGSVGARWIIRGSTPDACFRNLSSLLELANRSFSGAYLEWRPDGVSHSTYFEIRGPGTASPEYRWLQFIHNYSLYCELTFPCAPLALMDPMDVYDDFEPTDALSDYSFDAGAAANLALDPLGLKTFSSGTQGTTNRFVHTRRGHPVLEGQRTAHFYATTLTGMVAGVLARRQPADPSTYIAAYMDQDGTRLRVDVVLAGSTFMRASQAVVSLVAGTDFWVRLRVEGQTVQADLFVSPPSAAGAVTTQTTVYLLTAAEQAALGPGYNGLMWRPGTTGARLHDYEDLPFTRWRQEIPQAIGWLDEIPGDSEAPALVDVSISPFSSGDVPAFGLIAWAQRPAVANLVWNGSFEEGSSVVPWTTVGVSGIHATASAMSVLTGAKARFGFRYAEVTTDSGTADSGVSYRIYGRFRRGTTYTAKVWVRRDAAGTGPNIRVKLGWGTGDIAVGSNVSLSTDWQELSVEWTPAADQVSASIAVTYATASSVVFSLDGAVVYEGRATAAPARRSGREGRGGLAPFGVIPAIAVKEAGLGWVNTSVPGDYRGSGIGLQRTIPSSEAVAAVAEYVVDPALMLPDPFGALRELDVEVWARMKLSSGLVSPRAVLSARPGSANIGAPRYTGEYGSVGKALIKPPGTGSNQVMVVRLGTITFVVDPQGTPWILRIDLNAGPGSTGVYGLDELWLVPARQVARSPTGKSRTSGYPFFLSANTAVSKTIRSDLSGVVGSDDISRGGSFPDTGLGGAMLELPSGPTGLLVSMESSVPDEPVPSAYSQRAWTATVHMAVWPRVLMARSD